MATSSLSSSQTLYFDPDLHPEDTLKQFDEFINRFELRYAAQYPDPPKVSIDSAMERWKIVNVDMKITLDEYDNVKEKWTSQDMVTKFLGIFSSPRLWKTAEPDESARKKASWKSFTATMKTFYKPTENMTLKHYQFRQITQGSDEVFTAFCSRVDKEAKHCNFKCKYDDCSAEQTVIRDQIIIGTHNEKIKQDALKESWDLKTIRANGMQIESAERGARELSKGNDLNKIGKYSRKQRTEDKIQRGQKEGQQQHQPKKCYFCGAQVNGSIMEHVRFCKAKKSK